MNLEEKTTILVAKTQNLLAKLDGPKPKKLNHRVLKSDLQNAISKNDESTLKSYP